MEGAKKENACIEVLNTARVTKIFSYTMLLIGLIYLGFKNYLLYHTAVEIFSITIAFTMTVISISTYELNKDARIIFLGIAYGFIAFFDLIHTLAYKGMGIFLHNSADLPTQLWIIARYMESISLFIVLRFSNKRFNLRRVSLAYLGTSVLLMLSVFYSGIFPSCFIEGSGLTLFKIVSEYIICGILIMGIFYVVKKHNDFSKRLFVFLLLSLVTTVISEILFTYYVDVYGLSNLLGHAFKLASFYLIYLALAETSLKEPHLAQLELNRLLNEKNKRLEEAMEQLKLEYGKREEMEIKQALLEKAKEMEEIKTSFLCNVSHELKTPVNVILGSIQLMTNIYEKGTRYPRYEQPKKYLQIMRQNCNRLIKIVNNLVDITKIDSGFMQMHFRNYNIVSIIEDITLSVASYIGSNGISLIFDTDIEEKHMACDADKMERVMLNLLSNAVKYTEAGGKIWVNVRDKEGGVVISVKDTGIGIPKDLQRSIFDRFKQVDSSLARPREGSGIGLSIVKSIVEMHGGKISLISEAGVGSEFVIELPGRLIGKGCVSDEAAAAREPNVERISIEFSDIYEIKYF